MVMLTNGPLKDKPTMLLDQSKDEHVVSASRGKYLSGDAVYALTSLNRIGIISLSAQEPKFEFFVNLSHPTTIIKVFDNNANNYVLGPTIFAGILIKDDF